jgi:hypothetical protein
MRGQAVSEFSNFPELEKFIEELIAEERRKWDETDDDAEWDSENPIHHPEDVQNHIENVLSGYSLKSFKLNGDMTAASHWEDGRISALGMRNAHEFTIWADYNGVRYYFECDPCDSFCGLGDVRDEIRELEI